MQVISKKKMLRILLRKSVVIIQKGSSKKKSAEIPDTGTGEIVGEIHQLISEESGSISYRSTEHIKNDCLKNYLK